jgi:hypothetical protein
MLGEAGAVLVLTGDRCRNVTPYPPARLVVTFAPLSVVNVTRDVPGFWLVTFASLRVVNVTRDVL